MEVLQLIAALGNELAPLESLIAHGVAQDPDFFLHRGDEVKAALMQLVQGLLASAPKGRVLIEPSEESSGLAVNNLGGINSITLKNSYRRRAYAYIEHLKDVQEDGSETVSRSLVKEFELAPVSGFQGVLGTIGGYFAKDIAYTPVKAEAVELAVPSGVKFSQYQVVVVGPGQQQGPRLAELTPEQLPGSGLRQRVRCRLRFGGLHRLYDGQYARSGPDQQPLPGPEWWPPTGWWAGSMCQVMSSMGASWPLITTAPRRRDIWDVKATAPKVELTPKSQELAVYGNLDYDHRIVAKTVDDLGGGTPTGLAFAYHWQCAGVAGHLINPQNPTDTSNDFETSSEYVLYVADLGVADTETVRCEVFVKQGPTLKSVGLNTASILVKAPQVTLEPL